MIRCLIIVDEYLLDDDGWLWLEEGVEVVGIGLDFLLKLVVLLLLFVDCGVMFF